MKVMTKKRRSLAVENEELRAKLEEAEQTLDAIRSGKVDALIVSGPDGERVFTLQGADHRYRRIVERMTEGAAIVSPKGTLLYANAAFAQLVATPLDRVLGSALRRYVPGEATASFNRLLHDARRSVARAEERTLLRSGARIIPVHVSAATEAEAWEGGSVCLIVTDLSGVMRDAEGRREQLSAQLTAALREKDYQRKFIESLFANAPAAIMVLRGTDHIVEIANEGTFALWGRRPTAVLGQALLRVIPELRGGVLETILTNVLRTGVPFVENELTFQVRRVGGLERVCVNAVCTPTRDADGTVDGVAVFALDVTAQVEARRRAVDAERLARDKAEEAARLKDEFLATLSHELRTPLNAVLGWSRMLQTGALTDGQRGKALDTIVRNATAQNQLIEDLLDVSRIVSGKMCLNVTAVGVVEVVLAAIDVVQPAADAKGVRIVSALERETGVISGDGGRLQQVVWNLLSNAVKFTPRGGQVDVTLRRADSHVELAVIDTGAGIAESFLPYVFDRFRQQDGAITRKSGGLGLGLAIVKSIVELHGGTVEVGSDGENKGSRFVVKLPIAAVRATPIPSGAERLSPKPDGPAPAATPLSLDGFRVLVVDDEEDARELLRAALEHFHVQVTTAGSAAEALATIATARPDVIVSDVGMPLEDGYMFLRKLRAQPREAGGATPAIALTAYARPQDQRRALAAGFQRHASKPIEPEELVAVIADVVATSRGGVNGNQVPAGNVTSESGAGSVAVCGLGGAEGETAKSMWSASFAGAARRALSK
jgi:PAS domain S-box-containing protein